MPDFPVAPGFRPFGVVGSYDPSSVVGEALVVSGSKATTAAVWPAANRALYIPFVVEAQVTLFQIGVNVATQSGNLDVGVYDEFGRRLVSSGSTVVAAAGFQAVDITDTTLPPGGYYLAMVASSGTASFTRTAGTTQLLRCSGVLQQASALPLPDPFVPAVVATAYVPWIAASTVATI